MLRLPFRLPTRNEVGIAAALAIVALFASWLRRGEKIASLEAVIAAKPLTEDLRVEHIRRGPVKITRTTTTTPGGGKTTVQTREIEAEERSTSIAHNETPVTPAGAKPRRRYVGAAASPLDYRRPILSLGLNFWDRWDVGAGWDSRRKVSDGAFQIETRWRF